MNITEKSGEIKTWLKGHNGQTFIIIAIIILCSLASFYLGKQSSKSQESQPIQEIDGSINYSLADPQVYKPGSLALAVMNGSTSPQNALNSPESGEEAIDSTSSQNMDTTTSRYVASSNGRVYYFTWCAGAKKILPENRVYFNSASDARAVGLKASAACPGLD